jgi:hypothetical protein
MTTVETKPENQEPTKQSGDDSATPSTSQDEGKAEKFYGKEGESPEKEADASKEGDTDDDKTKDTDKADDNGSKDSDSDGKDGGKKETDDSDKEETKVPEKYELKQEENSLLNKGQLEEIEAYSKQQGFSNAQAQELLNREEKLLSGYKDSLDEEFSQKTEKWLEDIKTDKKIGGENFKKNIETAKRVIDKYASSEFKKVLNDSGFGNHPELVRTFVKIGESMSEDTYEKNSPDQKKSKQSIADRFYG